MSNRPSARLARGAGTLLLLGTIALTATVGAARDEVRRSIDETFEIAADGRVDLSNLNGDIDIRTWDRREVRIQGEIVADTEDDLESIRVEIENGRDFVEVEAKHEGVRDWRDRRRGHRSGHVDFELTVPRGAHLEISSVNGDVRVDGSEGRTDISLVNGEIVARNLSGRIDLSTVNGEIDAVFSRLDDVRSMDLSTVNGEVILALPGDADAHVEASTVHGDIDSRLDGGEARRHRNEWMTRSQSLSLRLGSGRVPIDLSTVNGRIELVETRRGRRG